MIFKAHQLVYYYEMSKYLEQELTMFGLFKSSPLKKSQKEHAALITKAFQAQRNGNVRLYSTITAEAETLRRKIDNLKSESAE